MKKLILALTFCALSLLAASCVPNHNDTSLLGEWAMTSGSTKINGVFTTLDVPASGYYKKMTFREDGTFTSTADGFSATGTYNVVSSSSIKFTYDVVPEGAPEWFAFRKSGTWNYTFLSADVFWFYDYGTAVEVAMTMTRIQ